MMQAPIGSFLALLALLWAAQGYGGVEVNRKRSTDQLMWTTLSGIITKATVKEVDSALREAGGRLIWVELNSKGGDWEAAMAIGRLLRRVPSVAQVDSGDECSSACVLILAGGQVRLVSTKGRVGIHRPYSTSTSPVSLEQSQSRFRALSAATREYLREMNLPEALFEAMVRVPPEKLRVLTEVEIQQFGLEGKDPAYAENVDTANANALGIDKQEYLRRKVRSESMCSELSNRFIRAQENVSRTGRPPPKEKADELLALVEKWTQCRESVMRGER